MANELVGGVGVCVATTIFIKMHRARDMWITGIPLVWLVTVCFTAGWQKIFSYQPRLGFLADAARLQNALDSGKIAANQVAPTQGQIFNDRLDAVVCGMFLILVMLILVDSIRVWYGILSGSREASLDESPFLMSQLPADDLLGLY